jgi:hypothetical protein
VSNEQQANRRPDPERVERWRETIRALEKELRYLEWYRDEFERFSKIVRGNPRILHAESYFPAHVKAWYIDSQVMRIRRMVEQYTPGYDVWSLLQMLEDMRRAAEAFGRSEIEQLFDQDGAPEYPGELRDFLVQSMWDDVADDTPGTERLYARQIKDDIKSLKAATEDVKRWADLVVAHNAKDEPLAPAFSAISTAVDEITRIGKAYTATLTGASMMSFAPVDQYNWFDIFHIKWIDDQQR